MARTFLLYNFNLYRPYGQAEKEPEPFTVCGYRFCPISGAHRAKWLEDRRKRGRRMHLNARVSVPSKQGDSIIRCGGRIITYPIENKSRKIKFLEDILILMSILIGRNVVMKCSETRLAFPLQASKNCDVIVRDSRELEKYLNIAVNEILKPEWQAKYENGFHLKSFYNATDIFVYEPRFLAYVTIWEYLYRRDHQGKSYDDMSCISFSTKLNHLLSTYILSGKKKIPEERFRVFSDLRNQLSHNGTLPIENPRSPLAGSSSEECDGYLPFFERLTQVLVLKTIGMDVSVSLDRCGIKQEWDELSRTGKIRNYANLNPLP